MARLTEPELVNITHEVVAKYDGTADDFEVYVMLDDERRTFAVNGIRSASNGETTFVILQARVIGEKIIIDADALWDKNLWKALEAAGVPREQIVLAYKGERIPESSEA